MRIAAVKQSEIENWLELVSEVEPLFGPMIGVAGFQAGLVAAIVDKRAFGVRNDCGKLCGVVVVSYERNEVEWLAVANSDRKNGYGGKLLKHAIGRLNPMKPVTVQTFDKTVTVGLAARNLYLRFGFHEIGQAELNPAGLPTVMLKRPPGKSHSKASNLSKLPNVGKVLKKICWLSALKRGSSFRKLERRKYFDASVLSATQAPACTCCTE